MSSDRKVGQVVNLLERVDCAVRLGRRLVCPVGAVVKVRYFGCGLLVKAISGPGGFDGEIPLDHFLAHLFRHNLAGMDLHDARMWARTLHLRYEMIVGVHSLPGDCPAFDGLSWM
jgi:hypothetical protein